MSASVGTSAPAASPHQFGRVSAEAVRYANRLRVELDTVVPRGNTDAALRLVLDRVFDDAEIRRNFVDAEIRYTAMCGEVAREVLWSLGLSRDLVGLLSIGDVDLPDFARGTIDDLLKSAERWYRHICAEEGHGYDLPSRGSPSARRALISYLDQRYAFGTRPGLCERLAENSAIVAGGMRGLDDLATAHVRLAEGAHARARFIHPDNSFGTWHAITRMRSLGGKAATVIALPTTPQNALHIVPAQVAAFYGGEKAALASAGCALAEHDLWCITPVGNPSGTAMEPSQLVAVCRQIVASAPNATLLLDCTYVRTLPREDSVAMMTTVLDDTGVLDRVIFLDSFSKTHGLCGERIGAYFSANRQLFDEYHNVNMLLSAGNGRFKSAVVLAVAQATAEQTAVIDSLHRFWQRERLGLYHYLLTGGKFPELFDDAQEHLTPRQLDRPLGLYLLVKLRDGISGKDVLAMTGCLGVETPMTAGRYIRFSVGRITTPTYGRYVAHP